MRRIALLAVGLACIGLAACKPPRIDRVYAECQAETRAASAAPSNQAAAQVGMITCMEAWGYSRKLTDACSKDLLKPTKDASCYEPDPTRHVAVDPP